MLIKQIEPIYQLNNPSLGIPNMALPVMEFQVQGYKIINIFA
jgi:hypothetical protein